MNEKNEGSFQSLVLLSSQKRENLIPITWTRRLNSNLRKINLQGETDKGEGKIRRCARNGSRFSLGVDIKAKIDSSLSWRGIRWP